MRLIFLIVCAIVLAACQPLQVPHNATAGPAGANSPEAVPLPTATDAKSARPAPPPMASSTVESAPDLEAQIQELIDRADEAGRANRFEEAETILTEALTIDPHNFVALFLRSTMRRLQGKVDEALADADRAGEIEVATGLKLRAEALFVGGDLDGALAAVDEAVALDKLIYWELLTLRAQILLSMGEAQQAIDAYEEYLQHADSPEKRAEGLYLLGGAYLQLGDRESARSLFEEALELGLPPDFESLIQEWLETPE